MENIKNSKILVTGGAGFIGSNLIRSLLNNRNEVICLDNLSTGSKFNIHDFMNNPLFKFIKTDLNDKQVLRDAIMGCDYVFHYGISTSTDIKRLVYTNINGFINLLDVSLKEGVKRFIYGSDINLYHKFNYGVKLKEMGFNLDYLSTLDMMINISESYSLKGLDIIRLRYSNVYGEYQKFIGHDKNLSFLSKWIIALSNNKVDELTYKYNDSLDMIYIDDVVEINQKILTLNRNQLKKYDKEHINRVIDVGTGFGVKPYRIFDILKRIVNDTKDKLYIEHEEIDMGLIVDNRDLFNLIGKKDFVRIENGLNHLYEFYKIKD